MKDVFEKYSSIDQRLCQSHTHPLSDGIVIKSAGLMNVNHRSVVVEGVKIFIAMNR